MSALRRFFQYLLVKRYAVALELALQLLFAALDILLAALLFEP